jgi:hypothetical protein
MLDHAFAAEESAAGWAAGGCLAAGVAGTALRVNLDGDPPGTVGTRRGGAHAIGGGPAVPSCGMLAGAASWAGATPA